MEETREDIKFEKWYEFNIPNWDLDEAHTCPYAEEINDNYELNCTCLPERVQECIWDI